jgi:hypothetical protein
MMLFVSFLDNQILIEYIQLLVKQITNALHEISLIVIDKILRLQLLIINLPLLPKYQVHEQKPTLSDHPFIPRLIQPY